MQQQQQSAQQMFNIQPPQQQPTIISTEQIQKYLDENKQLILAIMESQNLGKLSECAQYQAQLQQNLMYLASIADLQPPAPSAPSQPQMPMQSTVPQGPFMQAPQTAITQQQSAAYGARLPFPVQQFDQQSLHVQQQQTMAGVMGMRMGGNSGLHQQSPRFMDAHNRQDASEAGSGDGQGK